MRALILGIVAALAAGAVGVSAQESAPTRAAVAQACTQQITATRPGTPEQGAEAGVYCACVIDRVAEALTPGEFAIFGRVGIARANNLPGPSQEEQDSFDTPETRNRMQVAQTSVTEQCPRPTLLRPQ